MDKKSDGARPIVVKYVLRRLAAKCASADVIDTLTDYFVRLQLGVDVTEGCEAAVPGTRRFLSNITTSL